MIVLQGEQDIGKSQWFMSLLPGHQEMGRQGALLNPQIKDSILDVLSFWLVEIGELDGTFRKADIAALKAFITTGTDSIRFPLRS